MTRQPEQLRLAPAALQPLPVGTIRPRGWLYRQLRLQADSLSGTLHQFWPDVAESAWIGGVAEGWERGPYWLDGVVPLAFALQDTALIATARHWVDAILERQHADGWLGPVQDTSDTRRQAFDPWPVFVLLKALTQYHEATDDERIIPAIRRFLQRLDILLDQQPLFDWGRYRWADLVITLHWLYERSAEPWLLELAAKVQRQGFDWRAHFAGFPYQEKSQLGDIYPPTPPPGCTFRLNMSSHVVNNAMAIKTPGIWHRQSGDPADHDATWRIMTTLDAYHGQANGVFSGDEHLAGLNPSQGTELCAVVEYQYSLETLLAASGDPLLADRLEYITFNALPATFAPDMWSHQYVQQVNQIHCAIVANNLYTNNRADANTFGLEPNYGCCTANMHQGWPKFVSHLWMRTPDDGLAAVTYAPCEFTTAVRDGMVRVTVTTEYPFDETVAIVVEADTTTWFPLWLRVPQWAAGATLTIDGKHEPLTPGAFHRIERHWDPQTSLQLRFPMSAEVIRRPQGAIAINRGPLLFALPIGEDWRRLIPGDDTRIAAGERLRPHCSPEIAEHLSDWEVAPTTPWNYALELDLEQPEHSLRFDHNPIDATPFAPDTPPVIATVYGRRLPQWGEEHGAAAPPPAGPVESVAPRERLQLIPYGCTNLRITEFPLLQP